MCSTDYRAKVFAGAARLGAVATALVWLAGCSQVEPIAPLDPITEAARLFLRLTVDHPAVNLSTSTTSAAYNTLQLTATAWNAEGGPMPELPAPAFRLVTDGDSTMVTVTAGGLVTALGETTDNGVLVIGELAVGNVRHADTAVVKVTAAATPPVLTAFSIDPISPAAAVRYIPSPTGTATVIALAISAGLIHNDVITPQALDAQGGLIAGLAIDYGSLDPVIAAVNRRTGTVTPLQEGAAKIVARTTAYGITKEDTATFIVQPPFAGSFTGGFDKIGRPGFSGAGLDTILPTITIVAGGIISWLSITEEPIDVTFDDPTSVAAVPMAVCDAAIQLISGLFTTDFCADGGNIASFVGSESGLSPDGLFAIRWRRFPVAGIYPFRSTLIGATGRVVVVEPTPLLP